MPMIQRKLSSIIYSTSFAGCSFVTENCCMDLVRSKPGQTHSRNSFLKHFSPTGDFYVEIHANAYTANVYSNLQAVYRDFGVQGFQNCRGYM